MERKLLLLVVALTAAVSLKAQIGYKGQMTASVSLGINHAGGYTGTVVVEGFLTRHALVGGGLYLDATRYRTDAGDRFRTQQSLGTAFYRQAFPLGRVMLLPSGGLLLGRESCDSHSDKGNLLPYKSQVVYGLVLGCDADYVVSRHLALTLRPQLHYLIRTHFDNVKIAMQAGIKWYF